jgi:hypothetical protein
MYSIYSRDDYTIEFHQFAEAMNACTEAMKLLAPVDIVRAIAFSTTMHMIEQAHPVPDNRGDWSPHISLLEAAKTMWLLARYTAHELARAEEHHDHLPDP